MSELTEERIRLLRANAGTRQGTYELLRDILPIVDTLLSKLDEMRELLDLAEAVITASVDYLPDDIAINARQRATRIRAALAQHHGTEGE